MGDESGSSSMAGLPLHFAEANQPIETQTINEGEWRTSPLVTFRLKSCNAMF